MTTSCNNSTLREVLIDLQLFALTEALPQAPAACADLAAIEDYLKKLHDLGVEYPTLASPN